MPKPDLKDAIAAQEELMARRGSLGVVHEAYALADPTAHPHGNTTGYEVGLDPDGNPCVNLLVQAKLPESDVHAEALAPKTIAGVPVRVVPTGLIRAFKPSRPRQAPLRLVPRRKPTATPEAAGVWTQPEVPAKGGASIGHYQITAGTIGALCVVRTAQGNYLSVLSNNHVLGNSNLAKPGDPILQPGAVDGGTLSHKVAALITFVPLAFGGPDNQVDAAVAWTRWERISPHHHSFTIALDPVEGTLGMGLMKDGRTTGHTTGQLVGINGSVVVSYEPEGGNASFSGQFRVAGSAGSFSEPGDSGSLIVAANGAHPVALLFAGGLDPDGINSTFACPIRAVMDALRVERFLNAVPARRS